MYIWQEESDQPWDNACPMRKEIIWGLRKEQTSIDIQRITRHVLMKNSYGELLL